MACPHGAPSPAPADRPLTASGAAPGGGAPPRGRRVGFGSSPGLGLCVSGSRGVFGSQAGFRVRCFACFRLRRNKRCLCGSESRRSSDWAPVTRRGVRSSDRETHAVLSRPLLFGSQLMMLFFFWIQEGGGSARTDSQFVQRAQEKKQRRPGSHAGEAACAGWGAREPRRGASGFKASATLWGH